MLKIKFYYLWVQLTVSFVDITTIVPKLNEFSTSKYSIQY